MRSTTSPAPDRTDVWRRRSLAGVLAAAIVVIAACQSGGSGASSQALPSASSARPANAVPSASASASSPEASPTSTAIVASPAVAIDPRADGLDVTFGEFAITLESAVIRPGRVTLVIHNAGQLTHGFEMKIHGSGSGGDRKKIETRTFRSGETLRVEADLTPGVYEIECYVSNHSAKGMSTSLEVRRDAPLVTADPGAPVPGTARIVQFAFVAASLDVPAGSRVTWTNEDPTPHTVTADGGAFDSRQLDPGASFSVTLGTTGSFGYHCDIHPTMVGTVLVH